MILLTTEYFSQVFKPVLTLRKLENHVQVPVLKSGAQRFSVSGSGGLHFEK